MQGAGLPSELVGWGDAECVGLDTRGDGACMHMPGMPGLCAAPTVDIGPGLQHIWMEGDGGVTHAGIFRDRLQVSCNMVGHLA